MAHRWKLAVIVGLGSALAGCNDDPNEPTQPASPALTEEVDASVTTLASSNTWMTRHSLMPWRMFMAAGSINGTIYLVGGRGREGTTLSRLDAYQVSTNTWVRKASMPSARAHPAGASMINGKLYVAGGSNRDNVWTKTLFVYDPATNSWSRKADMPRTSCDGEQGVIGGQLYVYTGCYASASAGAVFFRYNPATNSWTKRAAPPTDHANGAGTVVNGSFYLAGGFKECTECGDPGIIEGSYDVHAYNPSTNTWIKKASIISQTNYEMSAAALNGKLYVAGGVAWGENPSDVLQVYDPSTNRWTLKASMPILAQSGAAAAAAGKFFYLAGLEWLEPLDTPTKLFAYTP